MLRNPDSIPSSDTIIKDPALEPYFITRSNTGGYTLYENVTTGANKRAYIKTICYPGTFGTAMKRVAQEMLNKEGETYNLKEYIKRWESIKNSLTSILE